MTPNGNGPIKILMNLFDLTDATFLNWTPTFGSARLKVSLKAWLILTH